MLRIRISVLRFFFLTAIVSFSFKAYTQRQIADSMYDSDTEPDTSDYIPAFYYGALDYNLMIAASKGYPSEIERLIRMGANVDAQTNEGATPIIFAVVNNQFKAVETLLKYLPAINTVTLRYETPLLIAVKNDNFKIAEALIRASADVDFADRYGATPLHYASIYGYTDIADLLLYYDASPDMKSVEGSTPLLASIRAGFRDISDLLIHNGANMEARDNDGFTPFLMAAYYGDTVIMDMLYKKGVDLYAINRFNYNALTLSIISGQAEATKYLLRIGNNWEKSGSEAIDPYTVATMCGRRDMVKLLENYHVPGKASHKIDQLNLMVSSRFCLHDLYTGLSISFKEPYSNIGITAGCDLKLWYSRVLVKESEHVFHQYMDKGTMAYAGIFKDIPISNRPGKINLAFAPTLLGGYSFGNKLKGTLITPETKFMFIPSASLKILKKNLSLIVEADYIKTRYYQNGPIWIRFGFSFNHYFDNIRFQIKPLKWSY